MRSSLIVFPLVAIQIAPARSFVIVVSPQFGAAYTNSESSARNRPATWLYSKDNGCGGSFQSSLRAWDRNNERQSKPQPVCGGSYSNSVGALTGVSIGWMNPADESLSVESMNPAPYIKEPPAKEGLDQEKFENELDEFLERTELSDYEGMEEMNHDVDHVEEEEETEEENAESLSSRVEQLEKELAVLTRVEQLEKELAVLRGEVPLDDEEEENEATDPLEMNVSEKEATNPLEMNVGEKEATNPLGMRVGDIKAELDRLEIDYSDCFEKQELERRLREAQEENHNNFGYEDQSQEQEEVEQEDEEIVPEIMDMDDYKENERNGWGYDPPTQPFVEKEEKIKEEPLMGEVQVEQQSTLTYSVSNLISPGSVFKDMSAGVLEVELSAETDAPLLLYIYSKWFGPCIEMANEIEDVAFRLGTRCRVAKMDAERYPAVVQHLEVEGMPTILIMNGSRVFRRHEGSLQKEGILLLVEPFVTG